MCIYGWMYQYPKRLSEAVSTFLETILHQGRVEKSIKLEAYKKISRLFFEELSVKSPRMRVSKLCLISSFNIKDEPERVIHSIYTEIYQSFLLNC
jgi:hypothetical protein